MNLYPDGPLQNQLTVHVPRGAYRVDDTLQLSCALVLEHGATLHRVAVNGTDSNTAPLVWLDSARASLRGGA
eukprot:COSAG04_NODE_27465_length_282_cov_1.792350_1_plen_71_part_01